MQENPSGELLRCREIGVSIFRSKECSSRNQVGGQVDMRNIAIKNYRAKDDINLISYDINNIDKKEYIFL